MTKHCLLLHDMSAQHRSSESGTSTNVDIRLHSKMRADLLLCADSADGADVVFKDL